MRILRIGITLVLLLSLPAAAADISGKWSFSVDLDNGSHGSPAFIFEQKNDKLSGAYDGPLGQQKLTGTISGDTAQFAFEFTRDGETIKATYTAKIESATKMSGAVRFEGSGGSTSGKWTAVKK
jgi:hypothetical protein